MKKDIRPVLQEGWDGAYPSEGIGGAIIQEGTGIV